VDGALRLWVKEPILNAAGSSLPENMRGNTIAVKDVRGIQDVPGDLTHLYHVVLPEALPTPP
jgi:hypothetical protein